MLIFEKDHDPRILDIVYIDAGNDPDWMFPLHSHKDGLELSLTLEGINVYYVNNLQFCMVPGDIAIKNSSFIHSERTDREHRIKQLCILLSGVHLKGCNVNELAADERASVISTKENFELAKQLFLYIYKNYQKDAPLPEFINALLALIYRISKEQPPKEPQKPDLNNIINDVRCYLDEHFAEKITLEKLTEIFFISPYYLSRKFKEKTSYTINQYIVESRMGEAQRRLMFTEEPIRSIASSCGYEDIHYFYNSFKKYAKLSPTEFRKKYSKTAPNG